MAKAPDTLTAGRNVEYSIGYGTAFVVLHVAANQPEELAALGIYMVKDRDNTVRFVQHDGGTRYRVKPQKQVPNVARHIREYGAAAAAVAVPAAAPVVAEPAAAVPAAVAAPPTFEDQIAEQIAKTLPRFPKGSSIRVVWDDKREKANVTFYDPHGQERYCQDGTFYGSTQTTHIAARLEDLVSKAKTKESSSYR